MVPDRGPPSIGGVNLTTASPEASGNDASGSAGAVAHERAGPTTSIRYDSTVVPLFRTRTVTSPVSPGVNATFGASSDTTGSTEDKDYVSRGFDTESEPDTARRSQLTR